MRRPFSLVSKKIVQMRFTFIAVLVALSCGAVQSPTYAVAREQQAKRVGSFVDYEAPPASLKEMWDKTSAVVHGKIVSASTPTVANGSQLVHRAIEMQVYEVLRDERSAVKAGTKIRLIQAGGAATIGDVLYTTSASTRTLEVGDFVVLFLHAGTDGAFTLRFGDSGAFWLSEADPKFDVTVPHALRKMTAFEGASVLEQAKLLTLLRQLARRDALN